MSFCNRELVVNVYYAKADFDCLCSLHFLDLHKLLLSFHIFSKRSFIFKYAFSTAVFFDMRISLVLQNQVEAPWLKCIWCDGHKLSISDRGSHRDDMCLFLKRKVCRLNWWGLPLPAKSKSSHGKELAASCVDHAKALCTTLFNKHRYTKLGI